MSVNFICIYITRPNLELQEPESNLHAIPGQRFDQLSLLAEVSICAGNSKEKRPLPRSDTSSVHDRGRVKPVCKTSSETGLEKQIVRMLRAELRCNDIESVVSKWRLGQPWSFRGFSCCLECSKLCN